MSAIPTPTPTGYPGGPGSWPTEPGKADEPARLRSQAAVYVVAAMAILIVCFAGGAPGWGVAGALALGSSVAITLALGLRRPFGSLPGAVVAVMGMFALLVLLAMVGGPGSAYALVPLLGAFLLGFDWHLVRRLRPLPFGFGFLVVIGVADGDPWTYPAALVWLALALGALTSLESDRRAAQPKVEAITVGPVARDVETADVLTTVLIALAIALLAALVLSTPSCQRNDQRQGSSGSGSEYGSGSESGSGSGSGSGSSSGSGSGTGRTYVPDPDGRFLIPDSGSGSTTHGIPSPELLPGIGESDRTLRLDDGRIVEAERNADGTGRIVVTEPDGTSRRYEYRPQPDGTTRVQEFAPDGTPGRTLTYDPNGRIAEQGSGSGSSQDGTGASGQGQQDQQDQQDQAKQPDDRSSFDWRLLALAGIVLAAVAALVWWWSRRTPAPPPSAAPPWALRLAQEIDREGAARGTRRTRSQSLVRYADALRAGPLPDDRLPAVVDVVSSALFGRHDPGPEAQAWAESTWAGIIADHPTPGRAERRRAQAGAPPS